MDRFGHQNELLTQVNQFWNMLDDLAESSPDSYQKFIQKHMKEGKEFMAPPEPHLCLQTKILDPEEKVLFINICSWSRVSAPPSDAHPVPLSAGRLDDLSDGAGYRALVNWGSPFPGTGAILVTEKESVDHVTDIAYSPAVLKRAEQDPVESDQLIRLAMKYVEEKYKVTLCHAYRLAPFKLKGKLQRMKESLQGIEKPKEPKKEDPKKVTDSLLDQIKTIAVNGDDEEDHNPPISLTTEVNPKNVRPRLIEEISSTEIQEENSQVSPKHDLAVIKDESGRPVTLTLKVELEDVRSVSDCDLNVSTDDLMFEVPGRYRLHLNLPVSVDEEKVKAQYNKAKHVLTVTMSALHRPFKKSP